MTAMGRCVRREISIVQTHTPQHSGQEPFMRHLMPLLERALLPDPSQPDPVRVRLHVLQRLNVIGAWLPSLQVSKLFSYTYTQKDQLSIKALQRRYIPLPFVFSHTLSQCIYTHMQNKTQTGHLPPHPPAAPRRRQLARAQGRRRGPARLGRAHGPGRVRPAFAAAFAERIYGAFA